MPHLTLKEITRKWLDENGYDGLCNPDLGCKCTGSDLMECDEPGGVDCVAAMGRFEDDDGDELPPHEYYMDPAKPHDWRCTSCGACLSHGNIGRWRCAGSYYEHKCPDAHPQCGYFVARPIWEKGDK